MSKQYVVGKQYRVADSSKCEQLSEVLDTGLLQLPEVFTVTHVDSDGDAYSSTEGVLWRGKPSPDDVGWMAASYNSLQSGAFELVEEEGV